MAQTVLVVDDDPAQRRILEEVVSRDGYRVVSADGGEPALDMLNGPSGKDISCMILDLVMPGMDGMEVLEAIAPTHGDLPVIVLTAQAGVETVVKAMRAGADDFVMKPVSPERLYVSIRNALKVTALAGKVNRLQKKAKGKLDRKSTRLNSSHDQISYAVFCLKKKKKKSQTAIAEHTVSNARDHHPIETSV